MTSITQHEATKLIGHDVKMRLRGEEMFGGVTLRWGTLAGVHDDTLIVDDYHDCNGFGAGMGCMQHDGVEVELRYVLGLERNWHVIA